MLSQNQGKVLYLYVVYWLLVGWCKTGYFFCMTGLKYSFSGYGDEGSSWWRWWWVSTTMATGLCGSKSVLKNLSFGLIILVRFDHSELLRQNSGKGGGLVLTSYHLCGRGERRGGGEETKGHPRIIRIAGKSQIIHTWSDRAPNYFVSGEDNIKPGSIPRRYTIHLK